ncbi:glycerophosphoinositol inositolphosphodiesterase GDPD2 isoform X1 [Solea senegalensis]|uniref:Glycerophosphoinositol inositolphosphodiesterase GDPD2 isoform X1 n=2 Tax=Solea senegalensis TaxID=28829 RepID=A0AAV6SNQ1_SOLSE|nr:glycerophosphoinositol inositolphosphodiesterase GDPD2 isoform X1 [Solea senegalensis]KAG7518408.1 glycerophosphoinositol inositolphosphodiesterase GDPD2 isoform X1 [Solea senegalensis]
MPQEGCCRVCIWGLYSCHWRRHSSVNKRKHACCWFSVVTLSSLLSLCWMYICLVTFNDREDVNWQGFTKLKWWVNWFMVVIIISAVVTSYSVLLLLFALFQRALGEQLNLHWFHRIFLFLGVIFIAFGVIGISMEWRQEWPTVPLSLQATGPFLQFGAVGALTLLSSFVFQGFHRAKNGSKVLIALVFLTVSAAIFLCPLFIRSPCLVELSELPEKPKLIGHRGAPMLAPENTMMSFKSSVACGVTAFETDVQVSKDRIPFLMHDNGSDFLLRTTNVKEKFPGKRFKYSTDLTWEELQSLNAGDWFVKTDPFCSVGRLSETEKQTAQNETIPSLLQLLDLAKQHNISVIFDLYSPAQENDTNDTVSTILRSGIDPSLILWLPPAERPATSGFIQVYNNENEMFNKGGDHLNVKYSRLSTDKISELREKNVTVNLWVVNERWLFSLLWCAGASSVTTNSCHLLKDMERPDMLMSPRKYKIIWMSLDASSFLVMIVLYIIQRKTHSLCPGRGRERQTDSTSAWNEKELSPFLPTA